MAEVPDLPAKIRTLMRLTNNLKDSCYDCISGQRINTGDEDRDLEQISDQLSDLRDVLEKLFKATIAGIELPGSSFLVDQVDGLLSICGSYIREMETTLKQDNGRLEIKGPSPSLDFQVTLTTLAANTTSLRGIMATNQRTTNAVNPAVPVNNFIDSRNSTAYNFAGDQNVYNVSTINSEDQTRKEVCAWLSAPDPSSNYYSAIKKRGPETGLWFINGDIYNMWKVGAHSFAWVHGIPGSGKSVLCSTVIEDIARYCQDNPSFALAYFYFDFTDPNKQQTTALIRSFLTQLSFAFAGCPDVLVKLHAQCQSGWQQPSADDLIYTLKSVTECIPNVYLVVDALDECSEREDLLTLLTEFSNWNLNNLHILATSRRERDIEDSISHLLSAHMELERDTVDADIRTYLSLKLVKDPRFKIWTAEERREIKDALMQRAQGMFRLVTCQLDLLAKCSSLYKLRKALDILPKNLEDTYDRILINIGEEHRDDAVKLLQWLAFSARPLCLAEMAEIFTIDRHESIPQFNPDQRPREPRYILDICSSLVAISYNSLRDDHYSDPLRRVPDSVYKSGVLSLAHLSVKEYLTSGRIKDPSISYYHPNKKLSDTALSRECLAYLLQFSTVDCLKLCTEATISFGRYAAEFWIFHARSVDTLIAEDVQPLIASLFLSGDAAFSNWVRLFDVDHSSQFSGSVPHPLYYASRMGLDCVVNQILSIADRAVINMIGGFYGCALVAASAKGHQETVRLLLKSGADVNLAGGNYGTPLISSSARGHESIVRLLLQSGADVNLAGGNYGTPLMSASARGHESIIRLLLDSGADVNNLAAGHWETLLTSASGRVHEFIVRVLFNNEADINLTGEGYGTPLAIASAEGNESIVQLLLDSGADANLPGEDYGIPLTLASARGHESIVRLLLNSGADVNLAGESRDDKTPLISASAAGHESIVRLLLDSGADANLPGEDNRTPLILASAEGHESIVRVLLDSGADSNLTGGGYGTPLAIASAKGDESIVRLLLDSGVDVNLAGEDDKTPLISASAAGHESIVRLLLDSGADADLSGEDDGTPLILASARGDKSIVQLLLKSGADVNLAAGHWGTPLTSASAQGHESIVRFLLDSEADTSLAGGDYGAPLISASARGHESIVRLLLDSGADVNLAGRYWGSALVSSVASYLIVQESRRENIVRLLLERGADVGLKDRHGWSALMWARKRSRPDIAQLLLDNGADPEEVWCSNVDSVKLSFSD